EPFQTDETSAPFADAVCATAISNDTVRLFPLPRYPGGGSGWGFVPPLAKDPHPALPRITGGGREGKRQNATAARLNEPRRRCCALLPMTTPILHHRRRLDVHQHVDRIGVGVIGARPAVGVIDGAVA